MTSKEATGALYGHNLKLTLDILKVIMRSKKKSLGWLFE